MENYFPSSLGAAIPAKIAGPVPVPFSANEPSALADQMKKRKRKSAVTKFVSLTTAATANDNNAAKTNSPKGKKIAARLNVSTLATDADDTNPPPGKRSVNPSAVSELVDHMMDVTSKAERNLLAEYKVKILNTREVKSDELVSRIVAMVEAQLPPRLSIEERRHTLERVVLAKLNAASSCLKLKLAPLAQAYMRQKEENEMEELFYHMLVPQMSRREKSRIYGIMFSRFIDNPDVSFATGNPRMLGNIAPVDMWFLTYFVFVTCRRVRGDNLLQLGCVGMSTCGKSTIIEEPIRNTSHQLLSSTSSSGGDAGVGRFEVGKKNAIMLHDIAIGKIFGVDFEKLKAICRAETTVAKIHGHVAVLPPLHLFYSSNQRLMTHVVRSPSLFALAASNAAAAAAKRNGPKKPEGSNKKREFFFASTSNSTTVVKIHHQVNESLGKLKKSHVASEDLAAIQNRFLELFVRSKPYQEEAHINMNETFDRFHFIVGTFERAISILEKYSPSDFHSSHLYGYVIGALKKNSLYFEQVQNGTADGEEMAVAAEDDGDGNDDDDDCLFFEGGGGGGSGDGVDNGRGDDEKKKKKKKKKKKNENQNENEDNNDDNDDDDDDDNEDYSNDYDGNDDGDGNDDDDDDDDDDEDDDDEDDDDDDDRELLSGNDHQNDKYQQHYIRIFNLATKYNVH